MTLAAESGPPPGYTLFAAQGTATIVNDDPAPAFSITAGPNVAEGEQLVFTVSRSNDAQDPETVTVRTSDGTATQGRDYTATATALTFTQGMLTQTFVVQTDHDGLYNGPTPETVNATLSLPTGGTTVSATGATAAGGIVDQDPAPALALSPTNITHAEGNSGETDYVYTVTRNGDSQQSQTVDYGVAGSGTSPADGNDFVGGQLPSGTLSFATGQSAQTITVRVAGDTTVEPDEGFTVSLSNPNFGTITQATATGTIQNDDTTPPSGGDTPTPATAPTITGTHATTDAGEATVTPFGTSTVGGPVVIGDTNSGAMDSLTITLTGGGGALAGNGLSGSGNSYSLAATAPATLTAEVDALKFTPTAGAAGVANPTTFTLAVASSAGTTATDSNTVVTDTAAAPPNLTPDAVSISPWVTYDGSAFAITGTAASAAGVRSVEITAQVDGVATDLGAATVDANGIFSFKDVIGAHTQGFITATETNGAGGVASAQADYSLTGGLNEPNKGRAPFVAEQDSYTADGSTVTATSLFRGDGSPNNDASRRTTITAPGQTFVSDQFDDFKNDGTPETTFVFNRNHGLDTISLFRADGADHDTLSFTGSDFGNSITNVLNDTRQTAGGSSIIADPITGDTVKLAGISKKALTTYAQQDITFHA